MHGVGRFDESEHPRGTQGRFADKGGDEKPASKDKGDEPDKEEKRTLDDYCGTDAADINRELRGYDPDPNSTDFDISRIQKHIGTLDGLMARQSWAQETEVFRGFHSPGVEGLKPGAVLHDKGFTSTSRSRTVASEFGGGNGYIMHIRLPKGSKAIDISKYSMDPFEEEILLARGSKFRVVDVDHPKRELRVELYS